MERLATVVFADLIGSTGVFERLGNTRATEAVMRATHWISHAITAAGGEVVKYLGDGVLALFDNSRLAIDTMVQVQEDYHLWMQSLPADEAMPIRVGVVHGQLEVVDGDCYGDAVNTASRLSELAGADQIWTSAETVQHYGPAPDGLYRLLGRISVRGRKAPCMVYQVEWRGDSHSEVMTMQADMDSRFDPRSGLQLGWEIHLGSAGQQKSFKAFDLPVLIGRNVQAQFVLADPRVSRNHARLEWRNGGIVLVDLSSYGTWVRFSGSGGLVRLRRNDCVLHGRGRLALGAPFTDATAPVIDFDVM